MKKTLLKSSLIVPALGLFILGGVATQAAFADTTDTSANEAGTHEHRHFGWFQNQNLTDEQKAALEQAKTLRESGDFDGAKAVLDAAGITPPPAPEDRPALTDEQKAVLDQAKALRDSGDEEGAKALLESAGIPFPPRGMGQHADMPALTDAQKSAMEQARTLFESGDTEGAKAVLEAAGIPSPEHRGGFGPKAGS